MPSGKRIRTPDSFAYPHGPVDLTRPISDGNRESFIKDTLVAVAALEEWQGKVKAHPDDDQSPGDFDASVIPNPSNYQMSRDEISVADAAFNDDIKNGKSPSPIPFPYDPCIIDFCHVFNVQTVITRGQPSKHNARPADWQDSFGDWASGLYLLNRGDAGFARRCHAFNVLSMLNVDPASLPDGVGIEDHHVVKIGRHDVILGGGTRETAVPAIVDASDRGNYGAISTVRDSYSLANVKGISNLVGQLNNGPVTINLPSNSGKVSFLFKNQVITLGFYERDGNVLSPSQIRKAVSENDTKGFKFVALKQNDENWRGRLISQDQLITDVKSAMGQNAVSNFRKRGEGKTPIEQKTVNNALVQCRIHPDNSTCLGFRSFQINVVPFYSKDVDGNVSFGTALGERTNIHLNRTSQSARREAKEKDAAATERRRQQRKNQRKAKKNAVVEIPVVNDVVAPVINNIAPPVDVVVDTQTVDAV